jgi:two-component system alkaline phosphatase synthesis response regulator PhoP
MEKTKTYKILLVEDELALSRVLNLKFLGAGYHCDLAADGNDAYDKISKENYDLILLDLILPGIDGFEILEKIKASAKKPKIVVLSNLSQQSDVKRAKDLGALDFFVKSDIQLSDIITYVKKLLP